MSKRVLALIMALVMIVSLLPVSAFAEEIGADEIVEAAPVDEEIDEPEEPAEEPEPTEEPEEDPIEEPAEEPVEEPAEEPVEEPIEESAEELYALTAEQRQRIFSRDDGLWLFPVDKAHYGEIVDYNGCRGAEPCLFCGEIHSACIADAHTGSPYGAWGLDIAVPAGTEVLAPAAGTLYWTDYEWGGIGYTAVIEHPAENGWSYYTVFEHLDTVTLSTGSQIAVGDRLALSGSSGTSSEPEHLVYAMFMAESGMGERIAADPLTELAAIEAMGWLEEEQGCGMINNNPSAESEAQPEDDSAVFDALMKHPGTVRYSFDAEKVTAAANKAGEAPCRPMGPPRCPVQPGRSAPETHRMRRI